MTTYETRYLSQPGPFGRHQRVSLLLEATAIAHGLDTMRVGGRGFTAGTAPGFSSIGFQDTISLETSRAAVRTGDDRIMRKVALSEAEVPVPPSRRFGHKHVDEALEFAQRFRRGVLIKPRLVDSGPVDPKALQDPEEIRTAVRTWRKKTGSHATYLVERRMFGTEYAFYVVGDQVVSAARLRNRGWDEEIYRAAPQSFGELDSAVLSLVLRAFHALPAMPHGEIHLVCPGNTLDAERCVVVSASPQLGLQRLKQPQAWSAYIAERMIGHAVRNIEPLGIQAREQVAAEFTMNEVSEPRALAEGVQGWFAESGVEGSVGSGDREVTGTITAAPGQIATFSGLCDSGRLSQVRPQTVALRQIENES